MKINWDILLADFKSYLTLERSLAHNSIAAYMRDVAKLRHFMSERGIEPIEVKRSDIGPFLASLHDSALSQTSIVRTISSVRAFFNFLVITDKIDTSPMELVESITVARTLPDTLSYEEILRIFASIDLSATHGHRNRAIIEVLYSCGIRASELTSLRLSDLFLSDNVIRVIGKGNKQRLTPISDDAVKLLKLYIEERRNQTPHPAHQEILFLSKNGRRLNREMVFLIVRKVAQNAGVVKSIHPHTLRHSFASHLVQGGADILAVQQMLGHKSVTTTEIYTHLEVSSLKSAVEQLELGHKASKDH